MEYLFTYGYLKKEYADNPRFKVPRMPISWIGNGLYSGKIYQVAHYPGVVYKPKSSNKVTGDVYLIRDKPFLLKELDNYELSRPLFKKWPFEYNRIKREVLLKRKVIQCWVYEYVKPVKAFTILKSGKY